MKIAPDLDKLMWNIADSGEKDAAESFQKRFPELKHEMAKRMNLVKDIKKAKALLPSAPRPEFRLKPSVEASAFKPSKRLVLATVLILGAAVVFAASYSVFHARSSGPNTAQTRSAALAADSCITPPVKNVVSSPQTHSGHRLLHMPVPALETEPESQLNGKAVEQSPTTPEVTPPITNPDTGSKGQRIIMKQVPLSTALHAISAQYGLKIDTAQGFPDPTIDLDSEDKDAIAMLKDIGSKYNFGVVVEGDKSVLLVPQSKP